MSTRVIGFIEAETVHLDGRRTSLSALYGRFRRQLLPSELSAWNIHSFADSLREIGHPVGDYGGVVSVGNLLIADRGQTYVESAGSLREVAI